MDLTGIFVSQKNLRSMCMGTHLGISVAEARVEATERVTAKMTAEVDFMMSIVVCGVGVSFGNVRRS